MLLDIAKLLLQKNLVNYQNIKNVLEKNDSITIKSFKDSLISSGLIDRNVLEDQIRRNFGANIEDIKNIEIDKEILQHIRKETAAGHLVLPLRISDSKLVVAMADPSDLFLLDQLGFESGLGITPVMASKETIRNAVIKNYKIDFNDQHVEIESLDFSNSTENIISELKEYENNDGNGHASETSHTETTEKIEEPITQPKPEIEAGKNIESSNSHEIALGLEPKIDGAEEAQSSPSNAEKTVGSEFAPFKSSLSESTSENIEIERNPEVLENRSQNDNLQDLAKQPIDDDIILLDDKVAEKEKNDLNNSNPFTSALNKDELIPEVTEELTPFVREEQPLQEGEVEVEQLSEEKEPSDNNQSNLFTSAVSTTKEINDNKPLEEVTEDLSPILHKNEAFHKEESEYKEIEELKADEIISEPISKESNPFASPIKKDPENNLDEISDGPFVEKNPFDLAPDTVLTNTIDESTEQILEKEPIKDQIDLTKDELPKAAPEDINILIVDKSVTMQRVMTQTLEKIGYNVVNSDNAIDAISKINNSKPDLIVIDIKLPHMDGYQLCKTIKKNADTKDIPIVMLSGKDGILDKMKGKMAGANAYITKPFKPNRLTSIIEELTSN